MTLQQYRIEKDSLGELKVPENALYGAQTQRAVDNFPISDLIMPRSFIQALAYIKAACAYANQQLGLLDQIRATAIINASMQIATGNFDQHFPIDVFQTGSGTSTNMNCNEVIAKLAAQDCAETIHPNDHVNMSQSSNDVIPTAIHVAASLLLHEKLLPALNHLVQTLAAKQKSCANIVKTGRTHLMDAMPVRLDQEISAWQTQIEHNITRLQNVQPRLQALAQGGTAVGTGINTHPEFGQVFAARLSQITGLAFVPSSNYFLSLSTQDTAVELSGQLKVLATSLMKIANDLRWMNSGPLTGLAEITLPALQPGSSIMPGKINPVIPEAVTMVAAQIMGNDVTITIAGQSGNFELNVMLPVIAYNLLQSLQIASTASQVLADKAIAGFTVNHAKISQELALNPILVTALNPIIGYEKGAQIAKKAYAENRPIKEVAQELTDIPAAELDKLLDPSLLTGNK